LKHKPLGQLLVQRGVLAPMKLREALELQRASGNRLATECHVRKLASEEDLLACLSDQIGVPGVQISSLVLPLAILDVLPEQAAQKQLVLPVRMDPDRLFLAMADPLDGALLSELAFVSNRKVVAGVALSGLLRRAINDAYAAKRGGELDFRGEHATEADAALPVDFVYAREVARVPPELMTDPAPPPGRRRPGASSEISIQVDDSPVDIVISVDEPPPEPRGASQVAPLPRLRASVLVVDDDEELRRLMARVLRAKGLEVREAGRGLEALNQIKAAPPELLILDAMLPEIHGFDICRKLRASDRYGNIPIIMISSLYRGWRFARDLKESYGVDSFLEKPFTLDALWTTVERVLASRRRQPSPRPAARTEDLLRECMALFRAEDLDGAIEKCREGVRLDPLSAQLHFRLGIFYLKKKGMLYQALHELEEAVALDPELFSAQRSLAILYQRKGFKNKAIDMWERALRSSPTPEARDKIRNHLKNLL